MLIAQAIFILEHGPTHKQTDKLSDTTESVAHSTAVAAGVGNKTRHAPVNLDSMM